MKRLAFKMKLKAGFEEEYQKRHDEIWPELAQTLTDAGVHDYSIFWDRETNILFAVQKLAENHSSNTLPKTGIVRKW
jgi:L-rhamnose mutarotase